MIDCPWDLIPAKEGKSALKYIRCYKDDLIDCEDWIFEC